MIVVFTISPQILVLKLYQTDVFKVKNTFVFSSKGHASGPLDGPRVTRHLTKPCGETVDCVRLHYLHSDPR